MAFFVMVVTMVVVIMVGSDSALVCYQALKPAHAVVNCFEKKIYAFGYEYTLTNHLSNVRRPSFVCCRKL